MKDKYYIWTILSLTSILGLLAGLIVRNMVIVGLTLAISYILYKKSVKVARLTGKTERSKLLHAVTENMIEISGIAVAFFLTEAWPIIFALAAVGFREASLNQIRNMKHAITPEVLGRNERMIVIVLTYLISYLNPYILIYGLIIIGSMALIETGRQIFLFFKT